MISGKLDFMHRTPPPDLKREIESKYSDRYEEHVTNSTFYIFVNVRVPPFDDSDVRKAVSYAIDKPALARLFGSIYASAHSCRRAYRVMTRPSTSRIAWGNPNKPPDLEAARRLIADAGAEGRQRNCLG